jgi:hypothetical protein
MMPLLFAAAIAVPTPPPPEGAKREELVQYATPAFGVCARGARCRLGELWLTPKKASRVNAVLAVLSPPASANVKQLEKHYSSWFQKNKWVMLGSSLDEKTESLSISAMKWEDPKKPELARAVEIDVLGTSLEVREAVGLPMRARP